MPRLLQRWLRNRILRRDITYTNVSGELSASIFRVDVYLNYVSSFCKVLGYLVPSDPRRPICQGEGNFFSRRFEDVWGTSGEEGTVSCSKHCNRNILLDAEQRGRRPCFSSSLNDLSRFLLIIYLQ